ncbi:hypothetical protein RvY_13163, partial [Ramazzottius varieornatus]
MRQIEVAQVILQTSSLHEGSQNLALNPPIDTLTSTWSAILFIISSILAAASGLIFCTSVEELFLVLATSGFVSALLSFSAFAGDDFSGTLGVEAAAPSTAALMLTAGKHGSWETSLDNSLPFSKKYQPGSGIKKDQTKQVRMREEEIQ